ncbi:MAG TPA: DinB family protein [Candidatus Acidoferrales bacterium]|nr:DinB family protein [Candidatus Acidoferrales bacterium]
MVTIVEPILNELREEIPATRRVLERIPADKLAWKPHQKSRSLGELAMHIANIPGMAERVANSAEFTPGSVPPPSANSVEEIRAAFEKNARTAEEVLSNITEQTALGNWRLVFKGKRSSTNLASRYCERPC